MQLRNAEPTCSDSDMSTPLKSHSVEHHALGAQPAQVVVAEVVAVELPLGPKRFVFGHAAQPRERVRLFSAYSVTAISAALAE